MTCVWRPEASRGAFGKADQVLEDPFWEPAGRPEFAEARFLMRILHEFEEFHFHVLTALEGSRGGLGGTFGRQSGAQGGPWKS